MNRIITTVTCLAVLAGVSSAQSEFNKGGFYDPFGEIDGSLTVSITDKTSSYGNMIAAYDGWQSHEDSLAFPPGGRIRLESDRFTGSGSTVFGTVDGLMEWIFPHGQIRQDGLAFIRWTIGAYTEAGLGYSESSAEISFTIVEETDVLITRPTHYWPLDLVRHTDTGDEVVVSMYLDPLHQEDNISSYAAILEPGRYTVTMKAFSEPRNSPNSGDFVFEFKPLLCNAADYSAPFGTLDHADIDEFIEHYLMPESMRQDSADINQDGVTNEQDLYAYVELFVSGCQ